MRLKIAHITDTHIGITNPRTLEKLFKRLAREEFDLLVHTGDYCGGFIGSRSVRTTVNMIRQAMPNIPFCSTIGNHDLWHEGRRVSRSDKLISADSYTKSKTFPSPEIFHENLKAIREAFLAARVHFLDEDGPFRLESQPGLAIFGHMGWYNNHPNSNDFNFLPAALDGDTNRFLQKRALEGLYRNVDLLNPSDQFRIFVSHFPVVEILGDAKFSSDSWDGRLTEWLENELGVRCFLNGHAHQLHEGPKRFEPGTDYRKPTFRVWDIEFKDSVGKVCESAEDVKEKK